jgi:hypothetical protein
MSFEPTELSRGTRVAWVTQGIVVYLESDLRSIFPKVVDATRILLGKPWAGQLRMLRRWDRTSWEAWDLRQVGAFLQDLRLRGPGAPFWKIELADRPEFPEASLDWQDLPKAQGKYARTSYLRIRLPKTATPDEIRDMTLELADLLPIQQGRAGYFCHVIERDRRIGFDQAWAWARRFYGIDIIDQVKDTWDAPRGLLGINWLTVVGRKWQEGLLKSVDWDHIPPPLRVHKQKESIVVEAGARPTVGDMNQFQDLAPYTQVSEWVEPALVKKPTSFAGMFSDHQSREPWIRRFLAPTAWQDS